MERAVIADGSRWMLDTRMFKKGECGPRCWSRWRVFSFGTVAANLMEDSADA